MPHRDTALYQNILLRSRSATFQADDTHTLGELVNLEHQLNNKVTARGIANDILKKLQQHPHFKHVARVCIATLVDHSNQLRVLDSAMDDAGENKMMPGYSCFVDAGGSLFQLADGQMRILREVSLVINAFAKQGKPLQRSVRYIDEMGFKSGICLPLVHLGELRGYLFLNAREPLYFHLARPQDFLLYSLLVQIGQRVLHMACPFEPTSLPPALASLARWTGEAFEVQSFEDHLTQLLRKRHNCDKTVAVHADSELPPFLYAPSLIALNLLDLLEAQHLLRHDNPLKVRVYLEAGEVAFEVPTGWSQSDTNLFDQNVYYELGRRITSLGWKMELDGARTLIRCNFDPCYTEDPDILYSV